MTQEIHDAIVISIRMTELNCVAMAAYTELNNVLSKTTIEFLPDDQRKKILDAMDVLTAIDSKTMSVSIEKYLGSK